MYAYTCRIDAISISCIRENMAVFGLTQVICIYYQNTLRHLIDMGSAIVHIYSGIKCYAYLKIQKDEMLRYGDYTKV